jgi:hypothetical protein
MSFAIDGGSITKGRCTAPCITLNGGSNYNDADGVGLDASANLQPDESISGIQAPTLGFVTGVFESVPPEGDAPPTLDFNTIGTDFTSLSPVLQQLFFIGDGLTGDGTGSVQVFYVPSGAKKLYLGIPDTCDYGSGLPSCYGDNYGDFVVSYAISTESGSPEIKTFSPASGKVGSSVRIWGYNLLNATGVSFNGLSAKFTAESTLIDAVVPAGAASGLIEITTPKGKAQSKGVFTEVILSPATLAFGTVTTTKTLSVTVKNGGTTELTFSEAPTVTGTGAGDFALQPYSPPSTSTCLNGSVTLMQNQTCTYTVTFTNAGGTTSFSAELNIFDDFEGSPQLEKMTAKD